MYMRDVCRNYTWETFDVTAKDSTYKHNEFLLDLVNMIGSRKDHAGEKIQGCGEKQIQTSQGLHDFWLQSCCTRVMS